jgi:hypothetical protein
MLSRQTTYEREIPIKFIRLMGLGLRYNIGTYRELDCWYFAQVVE